MDGGKRNDAMAGQGGDNVLFDHADDVMYGDDKTSARTQYFPFFFFIHWSSQW